MRILTRFLKRYREAKKDDRQLYPKAKINVSKNKPCILIYLHRSESRVK